MLKDIKYFIDQDTERQEQLEVSWSNKIKENRLASLDVFKQTMPNIYQVLNSAKEYPESVFVNKEGELDIVNISTGKAFYGHDVNKSISNHLERFSANPHVVSFNSSSKVESLPREIEVLVVFGLGLGQHLIPLLQNYKIKHLVIYEPNLGYLDCSLSSGIWKQVFEIAAVKKTGVYLQTQLEPRRILVEFGELYDFSPFRHIYVYQHYHSELFDNTIAYLSTVTLNELGSMLRRPLLKRTHVDSLVPWPPIVRSREWSDEHLNEKRYQKNLEIFSLFFPDIANEFRQYKANKWKPLANASGEVNIFHIETNSALYGDSPVDMEHEAYNAFVKAPTKERLALTSKQGKSYSHSHQRMVKKIEKLFKGLSADEESLPDEVRALLLFGIGAGYKLQELYSNFEIDSLFICEPNRDFFYASLYAIDWNTIFTKANECNKRIYLNIGDDGSNLAKDLLTQLHAIGTHIIESMYFSQGYDNEKLKPAINNLHEELRGIIALGEYFDYSRYDVAHAKWAIENGVRIFDKSQQEPLVNELAETPVFIIGNGPSLDTLMPTIVAKKEKAIIISCGTALQALYKNNITPDFHAEIENCRATFDWAVRIGDIEFLKTVNLISCCGVHPDTIGLYKDTFLSMKEGAASTEIIKELLNDFNYPELKFAYPTVANFAINFALSAGFKQLYLLGIDLGFVDDKYHHSQYSGYYENGLELYSYATRANSSLLVRGNFRPYVSTKYEFNLARKVLEKAISAFPKADVFNLNDGAFIDGALSLSPDEVLTLSSSDDKKRALDWVINKAHNPILDKSFKSKFDTRFNNAMLINEVQGFTNLLFNEGITKERIKRLVELQREFVVDSFLNRHSIFLYYYNGSVNYINGILSKLLCLRNEFYFNEKASFVLNVWKKFIEDTLVSLSIYPDEFDAVTTFTLDRQKKALKNFLNEKRINFYSKTSSEVDGFYKRNVLKSFQDEKNTLNYQIEVLHDLNDLRLQDAQVHRIAFVIKDPKILTDLLLRKVSYPPFTIIFFPFDIEEKLRRAFFSAITILTSSEHVKLAIPKNISNVWGKLVFNGLSKLNLKKLNVYESDYLLIFSDVILREDDLLNGVGDRFQFIPNATHSFLYEKVMQ
ncbi:6-hydroxymethylpterin diphosphokinase MptE-like protein [Alteromonas macleodii]|uniref:motility associated factor glycosyltransferase family protein n=1 Tax=Alteromonas macleodii TaxID=28108 RepID=UPI00027E63AA|nr:6-hydroxymethylpterin diphosphokinase MptE-like protein [Alteromonas macleodii]AFS36496.1 hypothetical protein MASE_04735 [Alteromonas macleodii ATCC 27126]